MIRYTHKSAKTVRGVLTFVIYCSKKDSKTLPASAASVSAGCREADDVPASAGSVSAGSKEADGVPEPAVKAII